MRASRNLRSITPIIAAVMAVAALTGTGVAQAAPSMIAGPSKPAALPKDAAVSSTGHVLLPAAAAATAAAGHPGAGSGSFAGTAPSQGAVKVSPNTIIGTDDRYQINPTTYFPARAIGVITNNGGQWCTGWLINANTILTAGHCVYSGGSGGTWYTNLQFYPGYNASSTTPAPYGSCAASQVYTLNGWYSSGDTNYDAGIVKLNCTVGNTVGWFGMWWQSASLNGLATVVYGYPGDHPDTQWGSIDSVRTSTSTLIYYQNDTVGGESGSPVWQYRSGQSYCNGYCAMGIHTNGLTGSGDGATDNHGTRITQGNYTTFESIANS